MADAAVVIEGLEEFERALAALPGAINTELTAGMHEAVSLVEAGVKDRTPVGASGRGSYSKTLAQSIVTAVDGQGMGVIGHVGTNVDYAPYVEWPQRAHWPPVQPIYEWVRYSGKFGVYSLRTRRRMGRRSQVEEENQRATFMVRRAIALAGTAGVYMFRDGLAAARAGVIGAFERAVERVVARWI